jgi:hypothetical protein
MGLQDEALLMPVFMKTGFIKEMMRFYHGAIGRQPRVVPEGGLMVKSCGKYNLSRSQTFADTTLKESFCRQEPVSAAMSYPTTWTRASLRNRISFVQNDGLEMKVRHLISGCLVLERETGCVWESSKFSGNVSWR